MGGKTKQTQRTKNNARPSNSGRSAELLGSTGPSFVGFTTHSDLGMIPLAPGFSTTEYLPETFDSNITPEFQVILRKLSKKDPVTKVKALQELNTQVIESDLELIKSVLPLWPKFYHSLSNDVEHRVRESTQLVQSNITQKVGKSVAPYIKQLAPVWIASRFDNYGPAGSIALSSFKTSFPPHKIQEVLLYCQNEIMDYLTRNLTFHTASTLSNTKSVSPQDAENKYQRVIISSMKSFSFFLEIMSSKSCLDVDDKCQNLLQNQKLWSFAKHKISNFKSAFFELLCSVLQYAPRLIETNKNQIIQVCFQNLDDLDPLTSPHVWGCVLLIQTIFIEWHEQITFKKVIQPKFIAIFKAISNGGTSSVTRNFLPFLSKLSENEIKDLRLYEFYTELFDNMKTTIQLSSQSNVSASKADIASLGAAYFECLRFVFKKISNDVKENKSLNQVSQDYLQRYVIEILKWSLERENIVNKSIYRHCSALVAYWSSNSENKCYLELLTSFWTSLLSMITKSVSADNLQEVYVKNVIELIKYLYSATPALHDNKVKFGDNSNGKKEKREGDNKLLKCSSYVSKDLKEVVIKIVRIYIENTSKCNPNKYASQLKTLCLMFGDIDFYKRLSADGCLLTTLSNFVKYINDIENSSEDLVDIAFEIIFLLEKNKKMEQLKIIVKSKSSKVQIWVLQRILSYPLCIESGIRGILTEKEIVEIILRTAKEAVNESSTDKFNLLHKCFFQIDSGEILISQNVVEGILNIILEPLNTPGKEKMIDTCASFVAQVMPIICSDENSTNEFRHKVFLELFKFSVHASVNENLSEDSLWEVTTCWQDSLSCKDILLTESLLVECRNIIENKIISSTELPIDHLDNISDMVAKLILCSSESLNVNENSKANIDQIEKKINLLLNSSDLDKTILNNLDNMCKFHEALQKVITVDIITNDYSKNIPADVVRNFYRKIYFTFSVIFKLTCDIKIEEKQNIEAENEDVSVSEIDIGNDNENCKLLTNWSTNLYELINNSISISALGESLLKNCSWINKDVEDIILNLSERTALLLHNSSEFHVNMIKDYIIKNALNGDILWLRTLPYLLSSNCYQQYNESGPIVLMEEIADPLLTNGKFEIYNNLAEIFLSYLTPRSLIFNEDILNNVDNIKFLSSLLRNLLQNHMSSRSYSEMEDKHLVTSCIKFITQIGEKHTINKERLLYNIDISDKEFKDVIAVVEFIKLLTETLNRFPTELNIKNWDSIRIGLCSWVLTISKSVEKIYDAKVSLFIESVYELFATLSKFIKAEKSRSSTQFLLNIIDEWENVFSKEVNLVLFKNYHSLVNIIKGKDSASFRLLLDQIASCVVYLDYNTIYNACLSGFKWNVNDLIEFSLDNLLNLKSIRKASANALKSISVHLMKKDLEKLEKNNETFNAIEKSGDDWHFLKQFDPFVSKYGQRLAEYINEFSYKLSELQDLKPIDKEIALTYFSLWDCIIHIFSKSPVELKSLYATWITSNKYEQLLLNFIFRAMPLEILKNHDQKSMNNDVFKINSCESQFQDGVLSVEKCACYMYTQMLRNLPVLVRKWWNGAHARQKNFIDKLTTNYVSNLIWHEDLLSINKTDKQENMQITVHQSTREVIAAYAIDEARMELIITLPQNHPLGVIKVEMGKQIGGKASSRNIGMQLTIFLTHQNGSIFDGLSLWKKNLDKKFSGVEECYVCYTVIHQDTCQLPKLSCKTCKKKFHGPCLYKWFTTSSKSTCPLCRNVF